MRTKRASDHEGAYEILLGSCCDIIGDECIGADLGAISYVDSAQDSGTTADDDTIADGRMSLATILRPRPQGDIVIDHHIVSNDRSLSDHHSHAMVDEESTTDSRAWVDLDPGLPTDVVRIDPGEESKLAIPHPMREAMAPDGVEPWIGEEDLQAGTRRWVSLHRIVDVLEDPRDDRDLSHHASIKSL